MTEIVARVAKRGIAHQPDAPALALQHVHVAYAPGVTGVTTSRSAQYSLEDITFAVERGQRVAVVGPNGAGKTTLFKLIVGTLRPAEGEVRIYGQKPTGHICVAYVPQRNQIDWSFPATVSDVVMMGRVGQIGMFRWPRRRDWQVVRDSLARVNASHLADKQIGTLSGGQQQRVFIARALAQEAELLLMDEPLAGLDVPSQETIFQILESLRPDGVTILLATHDLNMAAEHFDRVMLLNKRMIAYGPPAQVLTSTNLLTAYGGHVHVLGDDMGERMLLADTCCDHDEVMEP